MLLLLLLLRLKHELVLSSHITHTVTGVIHQICQSCCIFRPTACGAHTDALQLLKGWCPFLHSCLQVRLKFEAPHDKIFALHVI